MKPNPVHLRQYLTGDGRARTYCGEVVPDDQTTADCTRMTCRGKGCVAEADHRLNQRHALRAVRW